MDQEWARGTLRDTMEMSIIQEKQGVLEKGGVGGTRERKARSLLPKFGG